MYDVLFELGSESYIYHDQAAPGARICMVLFLAPLRKWLSCKGLMTSRVKGGMYLPISGFAVPSDGLDHVWTTIHVAVYIVSDGCSSR